MEGPEVHAPHAHHGTGNRWVDLILAVSAILISLISLVIAIEHGRVMQKLVEANQRQVQASTWPFLQIAVQTSYDDAKRPKSMGLIVSNHGNGPARIQTLQVSLDGKPQPSLGKLLRNCCWRADVAKADFADDLSDAAGSVLAQRESVTVSELTARNDIARAMLGTLITAAPRLQISACYCSVFDQCWIAADSGTTREVRACPIGAVNFRG